MLNVLTFITRLVLTLWGRYCCYCSSVDEYRSYATCPELTSEKQNWDLNLSSQAPEPLSSLSLYSENLYTIENLDDLHEYSFQHISVEWIFSLARYKNQQFWNVKAFCLFVFQKNVIYNSDNVLINCVVISLLANNILIFRMLFLW